MHDSRVGEAGSDERLGQGSLRVPSALLADFVLSSPEAWKRGHGDQEES